MNEQRPFRILGVQQVALGSEDRRSLRALWVELLGLRSVGVYADPSENVDEEILRVGVGPWQVEIDLMQPFDVSRKPRVSDPPLNHFGLWVDDLREAYAWLTARGVRFAPGGIRRGASGHDVCFIHPKGNEDFPRGGEGVLVELVQAPPSVIDAYDAAAAAEPSG